MLTDVPAEILLHIFSYLPAESLSAVSQTCRKLNSVSRVDSLWEQLCRPLPSFAPFQSWRDICSSRWYKWSWLVGIWCGDPTTHGRILIGRYNTQTGLFDFHDINVNLHTELGTFSENESVRFNKFRPEIQPKRRPIFSLPHHQFELQHINAGLFTTNDSVFIIPHKKYIGPMHLINLPESCLPFNLAPRTTHSNLPSSVMRASTTDRFSYIFTHTLESRLRVRNEEIFTDPLDSTEVAVEIFEKLDPTWMLPGLSRLAIPLTIDVEKPFQGLWVGDYSAHGGEILLFLQRTPSKLEVIEVTGYRHAPHGEYSFVIPNMDGPSRICHEMEFTGVRAVQGWGQIRGTYFYHYDWVEVEVFLQSHDEIFVYWPRLSNISSFQRIKSHELLDPDYYGTNIRD